MDRVHLIIRVYDPTSHEHRPNAIDEGFGKSRMSIEYLLDKLLSPRKLGNPRIRWIRRRQIQFLTIFLLGVFLRSGLFDRLGFVKRQQVRIARTVNIRKLRKPSNRRFAQPRTSVGLGVLTSIEESDQPPIVLLVDLRSDHVIVALRAIDPNPKKCRCDRLGNRLGIVVPLIEKPNRSRLLGPLWPRQKDLSGNLIPRAVAAKHILQIRSPVILSLAHLAASCSAHQ